MATREWIAAEVGRRLATQLADAGIAPADTANNLKEPIDDALRMLGYDESLLGVPAPEPDSIGFLALALYTTLQAVWWRIGDRFDLSSADSNLRLQQSVATVERMLKLAEARVIGIFGGMPTGAESEDGGVIYVDEGTHTTGTLPVSHDFPYTVIGVGDG